MTTFHWEGITSPCLYLETDEFDERREFGVGLRVFWSERNQFFTTRKTSCFVGMVLREPTMHLPRVKVLVLGSIPERFRRSGPTTSRRG